MSIILEQLLNGLTIGSFYALIALGYSMVYGVMKLINFAHGDLFALGSYLGYTLLVWSAGAVSQRFGLWGGMAAALLFAFFAVGCAGVLMERVAYRPVQKSGRLPLVVSALGVSIFLENLIMAVWGPRYQAYPASVVPIYTISFGWFHITSMQLFILILSFILMLILYYIVQKTTFGAAIRATALDKEMATLLGIDVGKITLFIFFLGPALGGMAGVMNGMYYRQISFVMGWNYGLKAFTATILGGIGNIPAAMLGGLLLGLVEMFGAAYISSAWKDVFTFLILILILIFRPTGLIGEKVAEKV
ncbi:branched-chain amino acid transport system permease protein [Acetomicrobium thermoterrenum DSM 13490]|uniref:Branched-chain amino acid transport system permease protein n=1 Tax=Acetomicrobium thermoterrenum DSM 13490 TaxID=1120987 RepID=A0A1H3EST2_9BACT|nr:branched-chain amino acid ABC transporter permease [Acetomicrobium thermoterrenum]SDX81812.1 branched-chain amino acid transport system permease protein [Acetomicrobium thermoterrenum DSM 13490]